MVTFFKKRNPSAQGKKRIQSKADEAARYLPATRPHTITPESSQLNLPGQSASPFFTKLSAELRVAILTAAFGDRLIHVDLHHTNKPDIDSKEWRHGNFISTYALSSSVCHRIPPGYIGPASRRSPHEDTRYRLLAHGDSQPGNVPDKCSVGAMAFLLSCRQAYVEGIDVLYKTNTFRTCSSLLISLLGKFLLPQRLERIRSVELVWHLGCGWRQPWSYHVQVSDVQGGWEKTLKIMVERLPAYLPQLRELAFTINHDLRFWNGPVGNHRVWANTKVLQPFDDMARAMERLEELIVFVPLRVWKCWRDGREDERSESIRSGFGGLTVPGRFWREVRQDGTGLSRTRKGDSESGYWVCLGVDAVSFRPACLCF